MERVITRVSKESRSDFLTFPNIRTSLSFSFFTGRADLFRAKTRRWLSTVIERTLKSWLDLWDWIKREKEDRGWKIIEMRVLERMACVGKNGFARKTCFSVVQGFERWLARWVVNDAETIATSTVKLLNFSLLV